MTDYFFPSNSIIGKKVATFLHPRKLSTTGGNALENSNKLLIGFLSGTFLACHERAE